MTSGDGSVGVLMPLSAIALSMRASGRIGEVSIGGDISSSGKGSATVDLEGPVGSLSVGGKALPTGLALQA